MDETEDGYEVGYGKPPSESRFKAGVSGNPKGRPKGSRNMATLFIQIMQEPIMVTENGRSRKMTRIEAVFRQMVNKAHSGDQRAMREIVQLQRVFEAAEPSEETSPVSLERDKAVFQNFLERMRRIDKKSSSSVESQQN
jgi:hypothetical protein